MQTCISPSNPITVEALATVANVSAALCENSLDALQQMRCPKNPSEFTAARCRAEASRVTSNAVLCGGAEQCDEVCVVPVCRARSPARRAASDW